MVDMIEAARPGGLVPAPSTGMLSERNFLTGLASDGSVSNSGFWTSANFGLAHKWSGGVAGSGGGTVSYSFDSRALFTPAERQSLVSGLALWSAICNISFTDAPSYGSLVFTRNNSGSEYENDRDTGTNAGSRLLGYTLSASINIDKSLEM